VSCSGFLCISDVEPLGSVLKGLVYWFSSTLLLYTKLKSCYIRLLKSDSSYKKWRDKCIVEFSFFLQERTVGVTEFTIRLFNFQDSGRHIQHASGKVWCFSLIHQSLKFMQIISKNPVCASQETHCIYNKDHPVNVGEEIICWLFSGSRLHLWSSCHSFWLQIQRSQVWVLVPPDFLRSRGSGTGSTQPREDNWGATWMKK
jgi:hypothetical protein